MYLLPVIFASRSARQLLLVLLALSCGVSCIVVPASVRKYRHYLISSGTKDIVLNPGGTQQLQLLYTGCGGMLLKDGSTMILIDPFYSNAGLLRTLGRIHTIKENADGVMRDLKNRAGDPKAIQAVLLAHSHYDHLLDLPYLLQEHVLNDSCRIIGSRSAYHVLKSTVQRPFLFTEPHTQTARDPHWIYVSDHARVSVIAAKHADHFKLFGRPVHQMQGQVPEAGITSFRAKDQSSKAHEWLEGDVYAFMLELLDAQGNKKLRVFIQSTACDPPAGVPFPAVEDSVDIAVIGVASTNYTQDYPASLLQAIRPKYTVLVHWEDFFRKYGKQPYKVVRATQFREFLSRYSHTCKKDITDTTVQRIASFTTMPEPGTLLNIRY